jgi:hypothetical protein
VPCPEPDSLREWLQTVGTLAAVIVALGIAVAGWIRQRRRQPKLSLHFSPNPDAPWLDLQALSRPPSAWVRVRISNARGKHSAHDVELLVTQFRRLSKSVEDQQVPLDIRPLRWSNALDPQGYPMTRVTIPPGVTRYCDLLAIPQPTASIHEAAYGQSEEEIPRDIDAGEYSTYAPLQVFPEPTDGRHVLREGSYELEVAVCARDVDASFYKTTVSFNGVWRRGSEIWDGLAIDPFEQGRFLPESEAL